jgi:hypothetical protein
VIVMPETKFGVGAASAARRGCSGLHTTDVRDAPFLRRTEILSAWSESRPLAETETALLIERGVPARAIRRDADGAGYPLRVAEVGFEGASFLFASERPDAGVAPALIVVLRDEAGDVADIGALQIRTGLHATWARGDPDVRGAQSPPTALRPLVGRRIALGVVDRAARRDPHHVFREGGLAASGRRLPRSRGCVVR